MKLLQFIRKAFNWLTSPERFSLLFSSLFWGQKVNCLEISK